MSFFVLQFYPGGRDDHMLRGNFHTHTIFCDGRNTAQEMAERAVEIGFTHLGFSGHMDSEIRMELKEYNEEISRLQKTFRGRLDILRGAELDVLFQPRDEEEAGLLEQMEYLIGSVHYVQGADGNFFAVDDTAERLTEGCREHFGGDYYRLSRAYYDLEAQVCDRLHCTFIGHFDLITRFNDDLHYLDESDPRYYGPALEAMEYLISKDIPFEINCGAYNRGRKAELYPNRFLLKKLQEFGGEILINSDAHQKELLDGGFDHAVRTAIDCGFTHTNFLEHGPDGKIVFRQVPLDGELFS